jgi:hypothetical protein
MSNEIRKNETQVGSVDPTTLNPRDYPNFGEYWVAVQAAEQSIDLHSSTEQTEEPSMPLDPSFRFRITESGGPDPFIGSEE